MYYVADTNRLLSEGVLTGHQIETLRLQARETMMKLGVNTLLTGGIVAATFGLIFWLAAPLPVALSGIVALILGLFALIKGGETLRFFGNAAALIGAGLLLGGAGFELIDKHEGIAGPVMLVLGLGVAVLFGLALRHPAVTARFACGAIFLMGLGLHLWGLGVLADQNDWSGWPVAIASLYAAAVIAAAGIELDLRCVTALAIVPFAQALSTGTAYWHATYAFYSPESTLTILQMSLLVAAGAWAATRLPARLGRHGGILAIMAAVVANLSALVGSLWGDVVGKTFWSPRWNDFVDSALRMSDRPTYNAQRAAYHAAREAYQASALTISDDVYSILWAIALAVVIFWSAHKARRGLFNTAVTFAGIHAYTQMFESFHDEPLAYVIGGLAAIPLAWGLWQVDRRYLAPRA